MSRSRAWLSGQIIGPLAVLAVVIGLLTLAAPAKSAFPGANGKIAFSSKRDDPNPNFCGSSCYEIYTMNPDGTAVARLTNNPGDDAQPAWSPDGRKIAFVSTRSGNSGEIYVMNADGTGVTRLTDTPSPSDSQGPAWSPDGTRIVFCRRELPDKIYTVNADGSGLAATGVRGSRPDWSPDGTRIVFDDSGYIATMNPDGTGVTILTNGNDYLASPSWSPDGQRIAFSNYYAGDQDADIFVMHADGTAVTRLTSDGGSEAGPTWSPDGTKIAFTQEYVNAGIYTMNADGSEQRRITGPYDGGPDWQPISNRPPDCSSVTATPNLLSPPDRSLRLVSLGGASDPDGDTVSLTITGVTQDEPLTGRDDNTGQDAFSKQLATDPFLASLLDNKPDEVYLRAESTRHGDGRVYRIAFTGSDGRGGTCSDTTTVAVPSKKGLTIDSAPPGYNSFSP